MVVPGLAHCGLSLVNATVGAPLVAAAAWGAVTVTSAAGTAIAAKARMAVRALAARRAMIHQPFALLPRRTPAARGRWRRYAENVIAACRVPRVARVTMPGRRAVRP